MGEATGFCGDFIRKHQPDILECWQNRVRTLPAARKLDQQTLVDHIPHVLQLIAQTYDRLCCSAPPCDTVEGVEIHALERLEEGFDIAALVIELGILRSCIVSSLESRTTDPVDIADLRILDEAIDLSVADAIDQYTAAKERTRHTLDRIASAALGTRDLTEFGESLLGILVDASESIDTATILVRDGDVLRVRATVGPEPAFPDDGIPVGQHFAGTIAASGEPIELCSAANDALVHQEGPRHAGVRALYGIPLIEGDEVIAVAHIGSLSSCTFSEDDKRLFRAVTNRVTAAISNHMLREAAERAAMELREREQEFRVLADNVPEFTWMADAHGQAYWWNQRWLDYAGTTLEHLRATGGPVSWIHPDHQQRVLDGYHQAVAAGALWEDTFPLRDRSGGYRWFLSRAMPVRNDTGSISRWFGTNTDVTNQRFLDEATKVLHSYLNYEVTLDQVAQLAVPDLADWCIVHLVDQDRAPRLVAAAHTDPALLQRLREWSEINAIVPAGVSVVIATGQPQLATDIHEQTLVEWAQNEEHLRILRELGLKSRIIAPLSARDRTLGTITLFTSRSMRKLDKSDLSLACELGRRAAIAVDNAHLYLTSQTAVHVRDEILAVVSHDLRGPLNVIRMSSALIEGDCPSAASKKRVELIQRSSERMEHMIDELLDMSTVQAKGLTLNRVACGAAELITEAVEAHEAKAASNGIGIVHPEELPREPIWCDRDHVDRVFGNLIGNAIKYCRSGDVIRIGGGVHGDQMIFYVADTGPGIPPDQVPHLFDPYWTVEREGMKKGTGLGLYISKGIVEAHGGRLWVDTEVGRGTTFHFTVPLAQARSGVRDHQPHAP